MRQTSSAWHVRRIRRLLTAIDGVWRNSVLELGFFLVIFSCMIPMRLGL